jgi:hypothetical protein
MAIKRHGSVRVALGAVLASTVVATTSATAAPQAPTSVRPVVIAVVGDVGFNVLHHDFATTNGSDPALPAGFPHAVSVRLPTSGSFQERLARAEAGPLGHLKPDTLYRVRDTRIIGVIAPSDIGQPATTTDVLADRLHGTGVTSAAVGLRYGTAPNALLVFVVGESSNAWKWVADQPWIDLAVTSNYTPVDAADPTNVANATCAGGSEITRIAASGRLVFGSAGDDDQQGIVQAPLGLPDVYQVGGVNADGTPWAGVHPNESDPTFATGQVTRPYVTGDLYSFMAASPDALTGPAPFGGDSGAAPLTAGRAATLLVAARQRLQTPNALRPGLQAWAGTAVRPPARGPLADGRLTAAELSLLLRHTATHSLPDSPASYAVEGYGALAPSSMHLAKSVLAGTAALPDRSKDDADYAAVTAARSVIFNRARCG